ncbi:hypothetical protein [Ramlibacter albus]|uniref:Uncharacterized protein n=1 Tax=Ramlibacter albus TaxID=2079448 RepID=A0A923MDH5_9BURK|nr:hypothetical protein [Ramlibacter albus]MBC5768705.1 hypothetical protein [Ramlibacter albus]
MFDRAEEKTLNVEGVRPRATAKAAYYLAAFGFHLALFLSNTGNYFHGGTALEWIALQAWAILIVMAAVNLVPHARAFEQPILMLCAIVPLFLVVWALLEASRR